MEDLKKIAKSAVNAAAADNSSCRDGSCISGKAIDVAKEENRTE